MKLLIIEDDLPFAATLARRLTKQGFSCTQVDQACDVLHQCHQVKPDYILLDMKLASISGLSLIKPIRAALPAVHMVLLTGYASITTAVEAMRLGANDYLAKPADTKMILKALLGDNTIEASKSIEVDTMSTERVEWEHIQQVLTSNEGNVSATARQLGMHRRTLQRKLQKKPVSH
ncbi:MAG: response regulator [Gammaproteobacteria bacterium]|nr:response regulator [Gammaproteobacteria bacterium]